MDLAAIQAALRDYKLDGWLFYDHHGRDPLAYRILGLDAAMHVTRRWFYLVPAEGMPRKLVHRIESGRLDTLPGEREAYSSWQELEAKLADELGRNSAVARKAEKAEKEAAAAAASAAAEGGAPEASA